MSISAPDLQVFELCNCQSLTVKQSKGPEVVFLKNDPRHELSLPNAQLWSKESFEKKKFWILFDSKDRHFSILAKKKPCIPIQGFSQNFKIQKYDRRKKTRLIKTNAQILSLVSF